MNTNRLSRAADCLLDLVGPQACDTFALITCASGAAFCYLGGEIAPKSRSANVVAVVGVGMLLFGIYNALRMVRVRREVGFLGKLVVCLSSAVLMGTMACCMADLGTNVVALFRAQPVLGLRIIHVLETLVYGCSTIWAVLHVAHKACSSARAEEFYPG